MVNSLSFLSLVPPTVSTLVFVVKAFQEGVYIPSLSFFSKGLIERFHTFVFDVCLLF